MAIQETKPASGKTRTELSIARRAAGINGGKPRISEKVFTKQVIDLARWYHWKTAHFRTAMTKRGNYVTAVQGDGAGFPDLVLVKEGWLIFAELKSDIGKLEVKQADWANDLLRVAMRCDPMVQWFCWQPKDYDSIIEILSK